MHSPCGNQSGKYTFPKKAICSFCGSCMHDWGDKVTICDSCRAKIDPKWKLP